MFIQILARKTEIPFEIQHRHNGGGHHFSIRHLTLSIFKMMHSLQHIITQTKNDYNLSVHEFFLCFGGRDTPTVIDNSWTFVNLHPKVATWVNL
jgi:hypothetical protein